MIRITDRYIMRDGKVYYQWRLDNDKGWNEKPTAYKDLPYVQFKWVNQAEFNKFYKKAAPQLTTK